MFSLAAKEDEECNTTGQTKRVLKTRFKEHLFKIKKAKKIDTFLYQHFRRAGHS